MHLGLPARLHSQQLVERFRARRSQSGQVRGTAGERDRLLLEARWARRARRERLAPAAAGKAHGPAAVPPGGGPQRRQRIWPDRVLAP
jgi:hypothetical protein